MNQPSIQFYNLAIPANLQVICKYHRNSKVFLSKKTKHGFKKSLELAVLAIDSNTIHTAYAYADIVKKTFPTGSDRIVHANNILVMVSNIIEIEWSYFQSNVYSTNNNNIDYQSTVSLIISRQQYSTDNIDLIQQCLSLLGTLKKLVLIKETVLNHTDVIINPPRTKRKLQSMNRKEKEPLIDKILLDDREKSDLIERMIKSRTEILKDYIFLIDDLDLYNQQELTVEDIELQILQLKTPKTGAELFHLLKKHVCHTVLFYLRVEMGWHRKKIVLSEQQGEYIYTVLLLFNLITPDDLSRHPCPRDKSKYISSFFKKGLKLKSLKFPELNFRGIPLPKQSSVNATVSENK